MTSTRITILKLHCLISGRLELRWNLFSRESLLSSHDELVGGLLVRALRPSVVPLGSIAAGTVVVVCEPTPLGPIAVPPLRYVPLHHGREPP